MKKPTRLLPMFVLASVIWGCGGSSGGAGSSSGTAPDTSAPSVPTNVAASAPSSRQISLSWSTSTDNVGVTGYKIYRSGVQIGTATTASYTDSSLTASTNYSYTVTAYDAAGNISAQSSASSATTASSGPTVKIGPALDSTIKPLLGINAGPLPAGTGVTADLTAQFADIGVQAIRTHDFIIYPSSVTGPGASNPGPLDMSTMYTDRTKNPTLQNSYNFTVSDQYFAAIVNGGFEPYFRLGDSAGLIQPPLPGERSNWEQASVQVLKHYTQGQWDGFNSTIKDVEIWNEPNSGLFWNRSRDEFLTLYVETAAVLRATFPSLRIGGAGFTQEFPKDTTSTGWLTAFLDKVQAANAPLDFLSFHIYTNDYNEPVTLANTLRTALDSRGLTATKIYLTEWNTYTDPATFPATLSQARALRAGALGVSILSAGWIKFQDSPIDRLFLYRGNGPNANTPEDYGLYLGNGTAKLTSAGFKLWSILAATQIRLATTVSGNSNLLALAGKDTNDRPVILVVNTANAATSWTPIDSNDQAFSGPHKLVTVSDDSATAVTTTPTFPISLPAYGVQMLSAN